MFIFEEWIEITPSGPGFPRRLMYKRSSCVRGLGLPVPLFASDLAGHRMAML